MDLGGIFLTANGFFPPALISSLPLPLFLHNPCLSVLYLNCAFFLRFCVSVQMYEVRPSAMWPCRCGREPVNETSKSPFLQTCLMEVNCSVGLLCSISDVSLAVDSVS